MKKTRYLNFMISLILIVLVSVPDSANSRANSLKTQFQNQLKSNPLAARQWALLSALGWQIVEESLPRGDYQIRTGPVLETQSNLEHEILTIALDTKNRSTFPASLRKLINHELPRLVQDTSLRDAFMVRWGIEQIEAAKQIAKTIEWPDDNISALGTGFDPYFNRFKKLPMHGESWHIKPKVLPSRFFNRLMNAKKSFLSSGCNIALSTLLNLGAYNMYARNPDGSLSDKAYIYDQNFFDLYINNNTFYSSDNSFLVRPLIDTKGSLLTANPWAMIGMGGYLEAVLQTVDDEDYFGENFVVVSTSQAAVNELQKEGLGFFLTGYEREPKDFAKFKGISQRMIQWWSKFQTVYTANLKKGVRKKDLTEACEFENFAACKSLEDMSKLPNLKKFDQLISTPFFMETTLFGHPGGTKSLKGWIYELASINPRTPYGMLFYNYNSATPQAPNGRLFERFVRSFLEGK